jgi:hypothetical protein
VRCSALKPALVALAAAALLPAGALAANPHGGGPPPKTTTAATTTASTTTTTATTEQHHGRGPSGGHGRQNGVHRTARGVVQSVGEGIVVIRQLDGSAVQVPYDAKTHFFVNGRRAKPGDVKAGYVLVASWRAGKPATTLHFLRG